MDAVKQMSLYGDLFYVCLAIAIIGLFLAVFFFFYFDIPTVFALLTGRAREKTLEKMMEQSKSHGSFRMKSSTSEELRQSGAKASVEDGKATNLKQASAPEVETQLLSQDEQNTTVLAPEEQNTTVLNSKPAVSQSGGGKSTNVLPNPPILENGQTAQLKDHSEQSVLHFDVFDTIEMIHTNELI